ncbi:hypothetical protein [Acidithiobacillus sp.]|uniref:hypothetical protein n=1 Tax=Acidithiobacillus sp. TaxID=1872118 RepID=UPI0032AEB83B
MNWVIDASVALKWFLRFQAEEDHVPQAIALLVQTLSGAADAVQPPHFYLFLVACLILGLGESPAPYIRESCCV